MQEGKKNMNNDIINKIKAYLNYFIKIDIDKYYTKLDFHKYLQSKIAKMSVIFGLKAIMEYEVYCNDRNGRVDVVWVNSNNKIIFAIEIDSCLRKKSIEKLNHINAENKIWILYCKKKYINLFNKLMSQYNTNNISTIFLDEPFCD